MTVAVSFDSPPPAETQSPGAAMAFTATSDEALEYAAVSAELSSGTTETVHDGAAFGLRYADGSTRLDVLGGHSYVVRRTGGWPEGQLTIHVSSFDVGTALLMEDDHPILTEGGEHLLVSP